MALPQPRRLYIVRKTLNRPRIAEATHALSSAAAAEREMDKKGRRSSSSEHLGQSRTRTNWLPAP